MDKMAGGQADRTGGTGQCLASLFRSYKIGKLGAVPNLGSFLLDLSEIKEAE